MNKFRLLLVVLCLLPCVAMAQTVNHNWRYTPNAGLPHDCVELSIRETNVYPENFYPSPPEQRPKELPADANFCHFCGARVQKR
jgi:hypothetical protein